MSHKIVEFVGDWLEPVKAEGATFSILQWVFDVPTRITKFEIEGETNGTVMSVRVGHEEQLVQNMVPLPITNLLLGPIMMPVITIGTYLQVYTRDFIGKVRPIGTQIIESTEQQTTAEICAYIDSRLQMAIANALRMGDFNDIALSSEVAGMLIKTGIAIARQYNVDKALLTGAVLGAIEDLYKK